MTTTAEHATTSDHAVDAIQQPVIRPAGYVGRHRRHGFDWLKLSRARRA